MRVLLEIDETDPPQGSALIEGGEKQAFAGWLGLMHVLADLTHSSLK
jgi:hypothetical protein